MKRISQDRRRTTLRFFGDDLDPALISDALNCQPDRGWRKGEVITKKDSGSTRVANTGMWSISAAPAESFNQQISELLEKTTDDLEAWQTLTSRFHADLFLGYWMEDHNDGFGMSQKAMSMIGERGLRLEIDIYDNSDD